MDAEIKNDIKSKKKEYYALEVEKIRQASNDTIPFGALTHLSKPDKPSTWSICKLRPGKSDEEIANKLADYFSRISGEFMPLSLDNPVTYSSPFVPSVGGSEIRSQESMKIQFWDLSLGSDREWRITLTT